LPLKKSDNVIRKGEDEIDMKQSYTTKNNGSTLPLVLVAIMILLTLGTGLLSIGLNGRILSMRDAADITARSAADAGLTKALFDMNQKILVQPWNDSVLPLAKLTNLTNCDASYSYMVTTNLAGEYVITSVGQSGTAIKIVEATLGLKGLFDDAILTKNSLILKSGTTIDGYNSKDPTDTDTYVKIGSQSTNDSSIVLNNGVIANGDVLAGKGGNPNTVIKDLGATVNGEKRAATQNEPLPKITAPALTNKGTISAKGTTVTVTPADNGIYNAIDLQKTSKATILEVSGGDVVLHITGNISLDQSCEIIVKDGATLTIYIDGNIISGNNSSISTEVPPAEAQTIKLYATGTGTQTLDVKAKGDWTGVIYAPNANVTLYANGDAYGAIVANSFEYKNGGNFYYDEALREASINELGTRFIVTRWSEMPATEGTTGYQKFQGILAR
jgi:hypothetical protein